jgi:hypothetical protein
MTAFSPLNIPQLQQSRPIVDKEGRPTPDFIRVLNDAIQSLKSAYNSLLDLPGIQDAIADAEAAAASATSAASAATSATAAQAHEAALVNSTISPASVLSASTTTITIASHTRNYADGTSKSVTGGTVAATASGDVDYVSYSDPSRAGGAVTYVASTTPPAQTGNIHVVGAVTIPASGTVSGGPGPRPGYVSP